jgi:hypothetical protein
LEGACHRSVGRIVDVALQYRSKKVGLQDPQGGVLPYERDASDPRHERRKLPETLGRLSQSQGDGLAAFPRPKTEKRRRRLDSGQHEALYRRAPILAHIRRAIREDRLAEFRERDRRTEERFRGLENEVRKIDNLTYRVTITEQSTATITTAIKELQSLLNQQSGGLKVVRENLQRIEPSQRDGAQLRR